MLLKRGERLYLASNSTSGAIWWVKWQNVAWVTDLCDLTALEADSGAALRIGP